MNIFEKQNLEIDINQLHIGQLEQLRKMFYMLGQTDKVKLINKRIAFLQGWVKEL